MTKRLIALLAVAFVAAFATGAYAEVQNVKVSGDIAAYGINKNQFGLIKKGTAGSAAGTLRNESTLASITRLKIDADLTDNVMATVRLLNERYWGAEANSTTSVDIDLAYATIKEFLYSPLTLTVGRQNLHFGNGMIVGDPDTNNQVSSVSPFSASRPGDSGLSARKAFDAIRATLNYDPLVVDIVGAKINERTINNNDDSNLMGANAAFEINKETSVQGYLFTKDTQKKAFSAAGTTGHSKGDQVETFGVLLNNKMEKENANLGTSLELAGQTGKYNDGSDKLAARRAWAGEAMVTLGLPKVKFGPSFTLLGLWFSGKKDPARAYESSKKYTGWDPMFEDQVAGDITNQMFDQTNARILGGVGTLKPADDVTLKGEYYMYWWDQPYSAGSTVTSRSGYPIVFNGKRWVGQELDMTATYAYTEDVQFSLMGGLFFPGAAFAENYRNTATEVIGSMKVTF